MTTQQWERIKIHFKAGEYNYNTDTPTVIVKQCPLFPKYVGLKCKIIGYFQTQQYLPLLRLAVISKAGLRPLRGFATLDDIEIIIEE